MATQTTPMQLSFPLPRSLDTRIYIHLTLQAKSILLFLTTATADDASNPPPMGSFVYALPDVSYCCLHPAPLHFCASRLGALAEHMCLDRSSAC